MTGGDGGGLALPAPSGTVRAAAAEEILPTVELVTYPCIGATVQRELKKAEQSVVGTAYCFDYAEGKLILESLRRRHVTVRVLLDDSQYRNPSSNRQPGVIRDLLQWGVEFRAFNPDRSRYAIMHAKTWLIDGTTVLTGSPNFTNNGLDNSEETHTVIRRQDEYVTKYLEWFERLWAVSTIVTQGCFSG